MSFLRGILLQNLSTSCALRYFFEGAALQNLLLVPLKLSACSFKIMLTDARSRSFDFAALRSG